MTAKQQMALETDGILRDMRTECAKGDDLMSLQKAQKLFRSITAVSNSNADKIEKILAGIYFCIYVYILNWHNRDMPFHALNTNEYQHARGGIFKNFTRDGVFNILVCAIADGNLKIKDARNRFASYMPETHKNKMDEKKRERVLIDANLSEKWSKKEQIENGIAQMQEKMKKINKDFKQNQQEFEERHKNMQYVGLQSIDQWRCL